MFKDSYKRDNERIFVSEEAGARIKENLKNNSSGDRRFIAVVKSYASVAVCAAVLIIAAGAILLRQPGGKYYETPFIPQSTGGMQTDINKNEQMTTSKPIDSESQDSLDGKNEISYLSYIPYYEAANNAVIKDNGTDYVRDIPTSSGNEKTYVTNGSNCICEIVNNECVNISRVTNGNVKTVSVIQAEGAVSLEIMGDTLCISSNCEDKGLSGTGRFYVKTSVYDISDMKKPKLKRELYQDGVFDCSICDEANAYIVTNCAAYISTREDISTYVPSHSVDGEKTYLSMDDIYFDSQPKTLNCSVITVIDVLGDKPSVVSAQAAFGYNGSVYIDEKGIILACEFFGLNSSYKINNRSRLLYIALSNGTANVMKKNDISGKIRKNMSVYCENGYIGMVASEIVRTTEINGSSQIILTSDYLIMFDDKFNVVSRSENTSEAALIQSVCFTDNSCYIAQITPARDKSFITAVDFTNPQRPIIAGRTELAGRVGSVSAYSKQAVLVMGVDENEIFNMKLLDVSDPNNITVTADKSFEEVSYDKQNDFDKMIDGTIIAFPHVPYFGYYVFSFDGEFTLAGNIEFEDIQSADRVNGVVINDRLYVTNGRIITCFNIK